MLCLVHMLKLYILGGEKKRVDIYNIFLKSFSPKFFFIFANTFPKQGTSENGGGLIVNDRLKYKVISNCCYPNCCHKNCGHFT